MAVNTFRRGQLPLWIEQRMLWKKNGLEDGIAEITKVFVDDSLVYQKTKYFQANEKEEIVDYLLENEKYTSVARGHFEKLA